MDDYKKIRKWEKVVEKEDEIIDLDDSFMFKILCFNVLAQHILYDNMYLMYTNHDNDALAWEKRKDLLVQEILNCRAHIICLQEVQKDHLNEFLFPFETNGFAYLYKKRTHEKCDGLLILYKKNLFNLIDYSKVEFYQTGVRSLSKDNVGLVAKFSLKESPRTEFVVATTHLLYNPLRSDVRLAQLQLLFAEIERLAFVEYTPEGPEYVPIVLTGDFNLQPYSPVYNFIIRGLIEFIGKNQNLEPGQDDCLSSSLIPPRFFVTDNCLHFDVLLQRLSGRRNGTVMLEHTEYQYSNPGADNSSKYLNEKSLVNCQTKECQTIEVAKGHYVTFSSGFLLHPFKFQSVYSHVNKKMEREVTTYHDDWITSDYIFYDKMKLLEKFKLPTEEECMKYFPTIPNSFIGSDHFCLGATFLVNKT